MSRIEADVVTCLCLHGQECLCYILAEGTTVSQQGAMTCAATLSRSMGLEGANSGD